MRSHIGGVISFGRGGILCKSNKQKINTKSSTEAELIGASDYLPHTLYVKMFMEAQGYPINNAVFYQDNESAIKMESNGKASCGQRSRHIDIRYFFITDHSRRQHITIQHCPTTQMLADYFTKPLQGSLFRLFWSVLLGHAHISTLSVPAPASPPAERVEYGNPASTTQPVNGSQPLMSLTPAPMTYDVSTALSHPKGSANRSPPIASHSIAKYPEG
jgi:hypothetical protein